MYTKVESVFWRDEKMRPLSDDARFLMLYLLTSPHRNLIGFYYLPIAYARHDVDWTEERLKNGLQELLQTERVLYDFESHVVLIRNYLKHNPLGNPNQAKSAIEKLNELPVTPLFAEFQAVLKQYGGRHAGLLQERLAERLGQPLITTAAESATTDPASPSESKRTRTSQPDAYTPEFERFWEAYPRKTEKRAAFKAWTTRLKEKHDPEAMIAAAANYAAHCRKQRTELRYIKHPATFLGPDKPFEDYVKGGPTRGESSGVRGADSTEGLYLPAD